MNYQQTIDFLYSQTPMFQQIGAAAYKPGLETVVALSEAFGNPHKRLKCIHVGGTNGKGSTSHSLAAVLQSAGYKVGLFTSPHLVDFRERIRINGAMIPREEVISFVEKFKKMGTLPRPSFFELTTVMAFDWFARNEVDYAIIEVGLGGRLDSTNIITPLLSIITNISFDHTAQLGNTLESIASEKAGIIKAEVPVVIGESAGSVRKVFEVKAKEVGAPIFFADEEEYEPINFSLKGACQAKNILTIQTAISVLRGNRGCWPGLPIQINPEAIIAGLGDVQGLTGLMGRWTTLSDKPLIVCDTGHNEGGWRYISQQLEAYPGALVMVLGFVNDKDISHILPLIPERAHIIYTRASVPRALAPAKLAEIGASLGRKGEQSANVGDALAKAMLLADKEKDTLIFVGGSTFVVADLLALQKDSVDE